MNWILKNWFPLGVLVLVIISLMSDGGDRVLGGTTNFDALDVTDGYSVDGTTVISGTGSITIASGQTLTINGTLAAATSTVGATTEGSGTFATSTGAGAADLLTEASLLYHTRVEYDPGPAGDTTLTIAASSTWTSLLPNSGDQRSWWFENTGTTTQDATIAAGTGIILLEPDGQNVVIPGGASALIHASRAADTDVMISIDELINAD